MKTSRTLNARQSGTDAKVKHPSYDLPKWFPLARLPETRRMTEMSAEDFEALPKGVHLFAFMDPDGKIGFVDVNVVARSHTKHPHVQLDFKSYWSVSGRPAYSLWPQPGHLGKEMVREAAKLESPGFLQKFV